MRRAAALAIALLVPGCASPFFSGEEVTASRVYDEALSAARAWSPGAELVGAFTMEAAMPLGAGEEGFPADPKPGNGKAPMWIFAFRDSDKSFAVAVNASGTTRAVGEDDDGHDEATAIGDWPIDSDDAMKVARGDAKFDGAVRGARGVGLGLGANESGPLWALFTFGNGSVVALVDARTGELRGVHDLGRGFPDYDWSWDYGGNRSNPSWNGSWTGTPRGGWGSWSGSGELYRDTRTGRVTAAQKVAAEEFPVDAARARVELTLYYDKRLPSDEVDLVLVDGSGAEVPAARKDDSGVAVGRPTMARMYETDAAGSYQAEVRVGGTTVTTEYRLEIVVYQ